MSQWSCARIPPIAAFVCDRSSFTRRVSFMTIMLALASRSETCADTRATSSRRDSCRQRRWCAVESNGAELGPLNDGFAAFLDVDGVSMREVDGPSSVSCILARELSRIAFLCRRSLSADS